VLATRRRRRQALGPTRNENEKEYRNEENERPYRAGYASYKQSHLESFQEIHGVSCELSFNFTVFPIHLESRESSAGEYVYGTFFTFLYFASGVENVL
jgi:hypothetical protein